MMYSIFHSSVLPRRLGVSCRLKRRLFSASPTMPLIMWSRSISFPHHPLVFISVLYHGLRKDESNDGNDWNDPHLCMISHLAKDSFESFRMLTPSSRLSPNASSFWRTAPDETSEIFTASIPFSDLLLVCRVFGRFTGWLTLKWWSKKKQRQAKWDRPQYSLFLPAEASLKLISYSTFALVLIGTHLSSLPMLANERWRRLHNRLEQPMTCWFLETGYLWVLTDTDTKVL